MCSSRGLALSGVIACPAEELGIEAMSFGRMSSGGSCGLSCRAYGLDCVKEDRLGCALMGRGGRSPWGMGATRVTQQFVVPLLGPELPRAGEGLIVSTPSQSPNNQ